MSDPIKTITVLVVDDEDLVRRGLAMIIDAQPDMTVVSTAGDGAEAVEIVRKQRPDVVLLDIQMPKVDGLTALSQIVRAGLPTAVLVLTTFDLDEYAYAALRAGAAGFLVKSCSPERLTQAIRAAYEGETALATTVVQRLVDRFVQLPPPVNPNCRPPGLEHLTQREMTVLITVADGLSNAEAARELQVSVATVKTHVNRLLAKLALRDRVQLVILAYESGLIHPGKSSDRKP